MPATKKRFALVWTEATAHQIRSLAKRYGLTTAAVIRQAVARWYESEPVPEAQRARANGAGRALRRVPAGTVSSRR